MPGLLKVLAEHLYSTQKVGLRELIQNAHDSCIRRAVEQPDANFHPRIEIGIDSKRNCLSISDNGSGLTEEEINNYLTVIGRGYTGELRERLAAEELGESRELVGQFGIGFLAAYLLAAKVTVETRSKSDRPLRWQSAGDEEFELTDGNRAETGTTVSLALKPAARFLLRQQNLLSVIREYADFLPTPIYVKGASEQVNLGKFPWNDSDPESACRDYVRSRFDESEPIWILPLVDGRIDLGHDTLTVPLRGILFVPATLEISLKEYGTVAVYIRGMSICDADKELLPPWARFLQGVIDCPVLQPTASREAVHQDDSFDAVRQVIAEQLGNGLRNLGRLQPQVWRQVVYGHSNIIVGWAAKDDEFFRLVADTVPLQTSRGRMALPEYLRSSGNIAYHTTTKLNSLQEKVLAEGRDVPVIEAHWFGVERFLDRYAVMRPGVKLKRLDDNIDSLIRPAPQEEFQELVELCEELGFDVRVSIFRPVQLPAVMTYPADSELIRDATNALDQGIVPDGFSSLLRGFIESRKSSVLSADRDGGILHLNASCPLIKRLVSSQVPSGKKQAAVAVVAYFARLFCGRMLDGARATTDLEAWHKSLEGLIHP